MGLARCKKLNLIWSGIQSVMKTICTYQCLSFHTAHRTPFSTHLLATLLHFHFSSENNWIQKVLFLSLNNCFHSHSIMAIIIMDISNFLTSHCCHKMSAEMYDVDVHILFCWSVLVFCPTLCFGSQYLLTGRLSGMRRSDHNSSVGQSTGQHRPDIRSLTFIFYILILQSPQ